jgi:hypothetical protein
MLFPVYRVAEGMGTVVIDLFPIWSLWQGHGIRVLMFLSIYLSVGPLGESSGLFLNDPQFLVSFYIALLLTCQIKRGTEDS